MTLDATALGSALADVFASYPATAADAADSLAAAYHGYASDAIFGPNLPVLPDAKKDVLAGLLLAAMSPATGLPATFAAAWANGVAAYWLAVAIEGPTPGAVPAVSGAPAITAAATTIFATLTNTATSCGADLAAALHTATMTVTAICSLPQPGTVLHIA